MNGQVGSRCSALRRDSSEQGSLWTWGGSIAKAVTIDKETAVR